MEGQQAGRGLHAALRHLLAEPGKPQRLASLISRYYDAIEADFAKEYPGIDPGALWRDRKWRKLLNLIDHLQFATHLKQAQLNDPEYTESLLEAQKRAEAEGKRGPTGHLISESTPEVREMRRVRQQVEALKAVVITFAGGKGSQPTVDQYQTTLREVQTELRKAKHESVVARMMPKKGQAPQNPASPATPAAPIEATRLQTK